MVEISQAGIRLDTADDTPLVVSFDGHYVWSLAPARDGRPVDGGVLVEWPEVLQRFLDGVTQVRLADVEGETVLHDDEVSLGSGTGRILVADAEGNRLCVDKSGHLTRAFAATAEEVRAEIVEGTARALRELQEYAGVSAYLGYGTLLGAVREGAMIAHDTDVDLCYLSERSSPAEVILESYRVERAMRARGWSVVRMSGGDIKLLLRLSDGRDCQIDVFAAFHVDGVFYQLGTASGPLPRAAILPLSTVALHGVEMAAPADPEAMLELHYGPGWRVPDPSFQPADPPEGVRRLDGWMRGFRDTVADWSELHQGDGLKLGRGGPSAFWTWVAGQLEPGTKVADLGCGSGRDAIRFATAGHPTDAYDFSYAAIAAVRWRTRRARRAGKSGATAYRFNLNELRHALTLGAQLSRDPHHLYARDLLGALSATGRANLWTLARMALRGSGHALFLEYAASGPDLPAPEPAGLVERLDPAAIRAEVERAGGVVEVCETAPGTDSLEHDDPLLCRMRVRFPRRAGHDTATPSGERP